MDRIGMLKSFLERNPRDSFCRHALAMEWVKRGDDSAAREELEALLEDDPDHAGSYYHLGKVMERQGDIEAAIAVYNRGIDAADRTGDAHAARELRQALEALED